VEKASPEMVWNRRPELTAGIVAAIESALEGVSRKGLRIEDVVSTEALSDMVGPALEYAQTLAINDTNYNQVLAELVRRVAGAVKVAGTSAALSDVLGIDWSDWGEDETKPLNSEALRANLIAQVKSGDLFASRAAVVLAKLDGLHPGAANTVGDVIAEKSKELKAAFGQKRFSVEAEMLLSEREYACLGMQLPKHLVGVVGNVPIDKVRERLVNVTDYAIVGASEYAQKLASELGVRYIDIPRAYSGYTAQGWADGQVQAVSDLVLMRTGKAAKQAVYERLHKLGKQVRFA
jgi:DNA-binding transcriptional regulator YdaS (Cro superfamily)